MITDVIYNFRVTFCDKDSHDLEQNEFFETEPRSIIRAINLIQDGHPEVEVSRIADGRKILEYLSTAIHPGSDSLRPDRVHRKKRVHD